MGVSPVLCPRLPPTLRQLDRFNAAKNPIPYLCREHLIDPGANASDFSGHLKNGRSDYSIDARVLCWD